MIKYNYKYKYNYDLSLFIPSYYVVDEEYPSRQHKWCEGSLLMDLI